jgi:hypothetical protein
MEAIENWQRQRKKEMLNRTKMWLQTTHGFSGTMKRPPEMESLSLQDVLTKYAWRQSKWCKKPSTTKTVLRVYPRFSPNPEDNQYDDYCRTKVILHHPFRDLNAIRNSDDQLWAEIFAQCRAGGHIHPKDNLRCWEEENRPQDEDEEDEELLNPDVEERGGGLADIG